VTRRAPDLAYRFALAGRADVDRALTVARGRSRVGGATGRGAGGAAGGVRGGLQGGAAS
jgi:hypothetical protein